MGICWQKYLNIAAPDDDDDEDCEQCHCFWITSVEFAVAAAATTVAH